MFYGIDGLIQVDSFGCGCFLIVFRIRFESIALAGVNGLIQVVVSMVSMFSFWLVSMVRFKSTVSMVSMESISNRFRIDFELI